MKDMEKYILFLLKDNNRIIIPNFGSFIKRPEVDGKISFNEFLKFDDGLLTDYITIKRKLIKEEAQKFIESFVDKVKSAFNEGKDYPLGSLGTLHKGSNGKIELLNSSDKAAETKKSTPKTETAKPSEKKEEKPASTTAKKETPKPKAAEEKPTEATAEPEVVKTTKAEPAKTAGTNKETAKTQESVKPADSTTKDSAKTTEAAKPGASTTKEPAKPAETAATSASSTTTSTSTSTTNQSTGSTPPPTSSTSTTTKSSSGENKLMIIMLVALIILIFLVGGFIFRKSIFPDIFDKNKTEIAETKKKIKSKKTNKAKKEIDETKKDSKKPTTVEKNKAGTSTLKPKDETVKKEVAKKETQKSTHTPKTQKNQYHIVAGCFKEKWRADKYTKTLQDKGFSNARVFGMVGNYHAISYDSYSSKQEAINELQKIRSEKQMKGWIKYY